MAGEQPTVIKKYANRRLYHTGTSTYVTLEDLARMVKNGEEFVVTDAKTGEEITRAVLGQIIFEQENRGQHLLPIAFLRQLIRFYGDSMQTVLPTYLESSLSSFTRNQDQLREQMQRALKGDPLGLIEDSTRRNMEMFREAMKMWLPFGPGPGGVGGAADAGAGGHAGNSSGAAGAVEERKGGSAAGGPGGGQESEIEELRRRMSEMQKAIDTIARRE
jgi:polyhydroxyalkanoate synthesis repressor PhaR